LAKDERKLLFKLDASLLIFASVGQGSVSNHFWRPTAVV
jgi:hypothetical protein